MNCKVINISQFLKCTLHISSYVKMCHMEGTLRFLAIWVMSKVIAITIQLAGRCLSYSNFTLNQKHFSIFVPKGRKAYESNIQSLVYECLRGKEKFIFISPITLLSFQQQFPQLPIFRTLMPRGEGFICIADDIHCVPS